MPASRNTTRSAWTCENCHRRKVRCDRSNPCKHCRRRGERCSWADNAQHHAVPAPAVAAPLNQSTAQLQARLEKVESILLQAGLGQPPAGLSGPDTEEHSVREQVENDLADADGFDHHIIDRYYPRRTLGSQSGDPAQPVQTSKQQALWLLQQHLPDQGRCQELIESYLRHVEWIHHPLHVPTFKDEVESFWSTFDPNPSGSLLPDIQWTSLLMIVLCLGSHFHPHDTNLALEKELYTASHELLTLSNYLATHSLVAIQVLILMGLWLNDRGLSNTHHAQLAIAIKMAVNLGYNKIDTTSIHRHAALKGDDDLFFSLKSNRRPEINSSNTDGESELHRRIWWSLVCQDYYTASSCNFTYSIHPKQCKTYLFLNLDDEETYTSSSLPNEPPLDQVATSATYHLVKIPFARIAKATVDLYNDNNLTYTATVDLETFLWKTYREMPNYLRWSDSPAVTRKTPASKHVNLEHLEWQRLFLGFTVHNRVLRLHRPFLIRSYTDHHKFHSREASLNSALACLQLGERGREIGFPGLRWWVILIHIFTAGVVFCIELHAIAGNVGVQDPISPDSRWESRREQVIRILELLEFAANRSTAAARAIKVLHGFLQQADRKAGHLTSGLAGSQQPQPRRAVEPVPDSLVLPGHPQPSARTLNIEQPLPPLLADNTIPEPDDLADVDWNQWDQILANIDEFDYGNLLA